MITGQGESFHQQAAGGPGGLAAAAAAAAIIDRLLDTCPPIIPLYIRKTISSVDSFLLPASSIRLTFGM